MRHNLSMLVLSGLALTAVAPQASEEPSDRPVEMLPPGAIPDMRAAVREQLEALGCLIPQFYIGHSPNNVVRGEFNGDGHEDWAVLCSRGETSAILVFWGESLAQFEFVAEEPNANNQRLDEDGTARDWARGLGVVGAEFIFDHHEMYGGPQPPRIDHEGIDDVYDECCSQVRYWHEGTWLTLTGSD